MKNFIYLLGFILLSITISCEKETVNQISDENNQESETIKDFSQFIGNWEVNAYSDSELIFGPFKVTTFKAGNDSITLLDTEEEFWKFQVKALAKVETGIFETKLLNCEKSDESIEIKIPNGKILDNDSIYFEIQFEDDETPFLHTYQLKGHRISE
ncbi:lipid-binding protein [Proteiniphilum sp.]|uniref:lipid-binding protein n=1 Tax=Proteiniphilum sp. TaxID=1926877 RepID=UPI003324786B